MCVRRISGAYPHVDPRLLFELLHSFVVFHKMSMFSQLRGQYADPLGLVRRDCFASGMHNGAL